MGKIYRVWLNASTESNGNRREKARYKAENIEDVVEEVKEELLEEIPEDMERKDFEGEVSLSWTEEYEHEEGSSYKTFTLQIIEDNSRNFPLETVTGDQLGEDLT